MRKKLFLLMIFITPCLSWAARNSVNKRGIDRRPANQPVSCALTPKRLKSNASAYSLGIKSQTEKMQFSLAEIMHKQSACADAGL